MAGTWTDLLKSDLVRIAGGACPVADRGDLIPGERREVAVLFCDLEGFTRLSEELDHEELHELVSAVMAALSSVVESSGGFVDKYEGDRLMALFGAHASREDDCERAVHCSLKMLRTISEIRPVLEERGLAIGARVGIGYGAVTVAPDPSGHTTATGEVVNLASRLEQAAEGSTVLVSDAAHSLCADSFEWSDLGLCTPRGKTRPEHVWRPMCPGRLLVERWDRTGIPGTAPLVGRRAELERLDGLWRTRDSLEPGRLGFARHTRVSIEGEPGIGKSRLVRGLLDGLGPLVRVVRLRGRSNLADSGDPWSKAILEAAGGGGGRCFDPVPLLERSGLSGEALARAASRLSDLALPPAGRPADPEAARLDRNLAARDFLRALNTMEEDLVIFVDDLQWLDGASRESLEFALAELDAQRPVFLVTTSRSGEERTAGLSLPEGTAREESFLLGPLGNEEILLLAAVLLGIDDPRELPAGAAEFLIDRVEGNPYFLEETLAGMLGSGLLSRTGGGWVLTGNPSASDLPRSIGLLIRSRMDRLPDMPRRALQVASVLGLEFQEELFVRTAAQDVPSAASELLRLEGLSFLEHDPESGSGSWRFRNPMLRDVACSTLLMHNRTVLHSRAAGALQAMGDCGSPLRMLELAHHLAESGRPEEAVDSALKGMESLLTLYRSREMLAWAGRTRIWIGDRHRTEDDRRMLRLLELETSALEYTGDVQALDSAYAASLALAESLGLVEEQCRILGALGQLRFSQGRIAEAEEAYGRCTGLARLIGSRTIEARTSTSLGILLSGTGRLDEAESLLEAALVIHRETGSVRLEGSTLLTLGMIWMQEGQMERAEEALLRSLELATAEGNLKARGTVLANLGILYAQQDLMDKALEHMNSALEIAREIGNRRGEGVILNNLAAFHCALDHDAEARAILEESIRLNRELCHRKSEAVALSNLGNLEGRAGNYGRAMECLGEAVSILESVGDGYGLIQARSYQGRILAETGETGRALALYMEVLAAMESKRIGKPSGGPFTNMRSALAAAGVPEADLPRPSHWPPDETSTVLPSSPPPENRSGGLEASSTSLEDFALRSSASSRICSSVFAGRGPASPD